MKAFQPDHQDRGELHGMTVVIETSDTRVYVGRYDQERDGLIVMKDADIFEEGQGSKEEYLKRAAQFGVWKKHDHVSIPSADVLSIRKLADITFERR